jgi:predicted RNase H-like HicB family nuclease
MTVKSLFDYHVVCHRDDNGSFVAYVPAIEGCHAIGHTPEKAQSGLRKVFKMISEEHAEQGKRLPDDVQLTAVHAPKPPNYFAGCHDKDEIEESNWFATRGPKNRRAMPTR